VNQRAILREQHRISDIPYHGRCTFANSAFSRREASLCEASRGDRRQCTVLAVSCNRRGLEGIV
jgi:hypothetical protein